MLFDNYYRSLCVYAFRFVSDGDDVEDIVQEVFVSFWMNKKRTVFSGSIRSYLFGAVAKAASKFATRRGKIKFDDVEKYVDQFLEELGEYDENEFARLRDKVYARVEALPGKTKEIFKAVVLDNMTYQQVGERFGITVNTIVFQHLLYSIELQTYNIHDFRLLQRGEHDDFVDTVQELRANRLFQHFVYLVIRLVKYLIPVILVDALQTFLNDMCTDIRSHDDNRIFEIDYPTFIIS